jgi:hypothetical protein
MVNQKSDPWDAVLRIKRKHEAVIKAAITVINVYKWQGEQQPKFFAEAMEELEDAVAVLAKPRALAEEGETVGVGS